MKTLIKKEWQNSEYTTSEYCLRHLENEAELAVLIQEFEKSLSPCAHCGAKGRIEYFYKLDAKFPRVTKYSEEPNQIEMVMIPYPHVLHVQCDGRRTEKMEDRCGAQSKTVYAEDDEADFKEALRVICKAWNRRPEKKQ